MVPLWFALVHKNALQFARLRVPLQCAPCLVVSLVLCLCLAFTVSLPCLCRVSVVSCLVLAVSWPWCRAVALVLPCRCPAFAMHLPCLFRVLPCRGRGLLCLCRVFAVALPCLCCCLPCVCRGIAVCLPWFCRVFAVSWPCVIAVRLPVLRVCCKFAMYCASFFLRVRNPATGTAPRERQSRQIQVCAGSPNPALNHQVISLHPFPSQSPPLVVMSWCMLLALRYGKGRRMCARSVCRDINE